VRLQLFDDSGKRSEVADWVEVQAMHLGRAVSSAELRRSDSVLSEPDNALDLDDVTGDEIEREIVDSEMEQLDDEIWAELKFRERVLGDSYPFELITNRSVWRLEPRSLEAPATRAPRVLYLSCLMMSAMKSGILRRDAEVDPQFDGLARRAADVLQAASYVAASELVGGESHWFGWPRPDGTTKMREALKELVRKVGHGKLKTKDPEWTTGYEKDGTIDVVVWRQFKDRRHGGVLVLGQVASGLNWIEKSPRTFVDSHFNDWFEEQLEHQFLTAMFIPFMLHERAIARHDSSYEDVANSIIRQLSIIHGTLIDRVRLVDLVHDRLAGADVDDRLVIFGSRLYGWYLRTRRAIVG
jgi:hypothetical protein